MQLPGRSKSRRRLALVLWKGDVGGAEVLTVALADQMRSLGIEATVVFIQGSRPLDVRLDHLGLPHRSIGLRRGRDVVWHPRRYAAAVGEAGPDGAILVTCGYMGAALRAGGYDAPIVAVEHGDILYDGRPQWLRWLARAAGARADEIEVGVSDFILQRVLEQPHAKEVRRIYNGIEPARFLAAGAEREDAASGAGCIAAFAGRLIHGKGADYLIEALAGLPADRRVEVRIAGDGPERPALEALAGRLGVADRVEFVGLEQDMPSFWAACDVAVVPSAEFVEACPMTPLEAMASAKPVIATRNGGLPELVVDGETGTLVEAGSSASLSGALDLYAGDAGLRRAHGEAGRIRAAERFPIRACAESYLELLDELAARRAP